MSIQRIDHIGIMVSNIEKSVAFYQQTLGLELAFRLPRTAPSEPLVFMAHPSSPDTYIELIANATSNLADEGRVHHLAFSVDNLDAEVARLTECGVQWIHAQPRSLPDGARYAFFYGPDREQLELFERVRA